MSYYDLGKYSWKVTTSSDEAQTWFDRGLNWIYGYNHEAAIECFEKALAADPHCVMAQWGIAYSIGPNYNKDWTAFEPEEKPVALETARGALAEAQKHLDNASDLEQALIAALVTRYPDDATIEDYAPWNDAYADAMRKVHADHGDNLDVCCLFAEALINRTPWALWNLKSGEPEPGASTLEAVQVQEAAFENLQGAWEHPGLLHMYIHTMEMSPTPEKALRHGDRLVNLVPDGGHLIHMPTHVDVLCGDYENVVARNHAAIVADRKYLAGEGPDNFYTIYRFHNYHFKIYGAMFLGQPGPAIEAAAELKSTINEEFLRPMADWFEAFLPMDQHVLIRFGRWQEILTQELPEDQELYSVTTAMMRYARTVALANLKRIDEAEAEKELFMKAMGAVQETRTLFNNVCTDILKVAEQMMRGELEYHKGKHELAFDHLRKSVELDDNLPYDEPWGWMQPTRHALGALLIEQGQYEEAEAVYRADLGLDHTLSRACQHPGNVWSLHGLHECLVKRGASEEAAIIKLQLDKAAARADVPVKASCYCRTIGLAAE